MISEITEATENCGRTDREHWDLKTSLPSEEGYCRQDKCGQRYGGMEKTYQN